MKKFIDTIKNIWKVEELRQRILLTLGLILIYRIGSFIVLPDINQAALASKASGQGTLVSMLDLFAGGAFSKASIMALGIMPYISASIIMQLLGMAVPVVQKMQKDGESGRRKINGYTRVLTILICAFQGPSYLQMYVVGRGGVAEGDATLMWWTSSIMLLIAGTMFAMWLGERITDKGVGNGISLLITVGILARFPSSVFSEFAERNSGAGGVFMFLVELLVFFAIIIVTVLIVQGVRRVPINYAKRVVGKATETGQRSYIPLKVNASGVMPIIFAQAIMTVPAMINSKNAFLADLADYRGFTYNLTFAILIIVFTYFYTAITINPKQIADDLKRNGGFVPGIKPGSETADFIDTILSRITFPGSFFLAAIAVIPAFAMLFGVGDGFAMFMGGTSMLIMVGVVLDTLQQIETYLLNRHYDGLMEGGRIRGRRGANEFSGI